MEGEKGKVIAGLKQSLKELKSELTATRELLQQHLDNSQQLESSLVELQKRRSEYHSRLTEILSHNGGERELSTYRGLIQKGVKPDEVKKRLIARGNPPEKVEALLEALNRKVGMQAREG